MSGTQPALTADAASLSYSQTSGASANPVSTLPLTLRNYGQTLFWTFAAVAACGLAYVIEKWLVFAPAGWLEYKHAVDYRMFKNPAELPMRIFGLPHFIIGLLFMIS